VTVDNVSGYNIGDTAIDVDGFSSALTVGSWCTIGGDMTPQLITAVSPASGSTTQITVSPGLKSAVVDDAVVTVYSPGAVNLTAGYANNWSKPLVTDGFSVAPKVGQLVSFGTGDARYGTLRTPTTTSMLLDRPLESGVADDAVVGIGPAGNYSLGFHPNAIALVSRPLAAPMAGTGARSFVAESDGMGLRVTITYDGNAQGHLVTLDMLYGVKVMYEELGVLVYS